MYCGKCGAENPDSAAFCKECGAPLNPSPSPVVSSSVSVSDAKKHRNIGIAAVGIAVLAVVILIVSLFSGRSYNSVAKKYMKATFKADGGAIIALMPDKVIDVACEESDMSKKEFIETCDSLLESIVSSYDLYYGTGWRYSYEITEVEDYSDSELEDLQEDYLDDFDLKVKDAKSLEITITITTKDGDETQANMSVGVVKIGRSWYLDAFNSSFV